MTTGDDESPVQEELWSRSAGDDEALVKMELWSQSSRDDKALVAGFARQWGGSMILEV